MRPTSDEHLGRRISGHERQGPAPPSAVRQDRRNTDRRRPGSGRPRRRGPPGLGQPGELANETRTGARTWPRSDLAAQAGRVVHGLGASADYEDRGESSTGGRPGCTMRHATASTGTRTFRVASN